MTNENIKKYKYKRGPVLGQWGGQTFKEKMQIHVKYEYKKYKYKCKWGLALGQWGEIDKHLKRKYKHRDKYKFKYKWSPALGQWVEQSIEKGGEEKM